LYPIFPEVSTIKGEMGEKRGGKSGFPLYNMRKFVYNISANESTGNEGNTP